MLEENVCQACDDYVFGRLDELSGKRFERHMRTCRTCRAEVAEAREMLRWIEEAQSRRDVTHPLAQGDSGLRGRARRWRRNLSWSAACLALLVLMSPSIVALRDEGPAPVKAAKHAVISYSVDMAHGGKKGLQDIRQLCGRSLIQLRDDVVDGLARVDDSKLHRL